MSYLNETVTITERKRGSGRNPTYTETTVATDVPVRIQRGFSRTGESIQGKTSMQRARLWTRSTDATETRYVTQSDGTRWQIVSVEDWGTFRRCELEESA